MKGGKDITYGAITVIGAGETPMDMITSVEDRDYFFDAPLAELKDPKYSNLTEIVSPIASTDFEEVVGKITKDTDPVLNDDQIRALQDQIATAEKRGMGTRYWNTPFWPVRQRDLVWRALVREGVKLLNVDDLEAAAKEF